MILLWRFFMQLFLESKERKIMEATPTASIRHPHQAEEDEGSACFGTGEEGNRIIAEERKDERGKCVFGNNFKSKQMKLYTNHRTGPYLCSSKTYYPFLSL